jgi:hypothetical protein
MPKGKLYLANDCDRLRLEDGLAYRLPVPQIADRIGVPERTLRRHYPEVFKAAEPKEGRRAFQPTAEQRVLVTLAAALGTPHDDIAAILKCSEKTVEKYFAEELSVGSARANIAVAGNLFKAATGDPSKLATVKAAIWWTISRMNWRACSRAGSAAKAADEAYDRQVVLERPQSTQNAAPAQSPLPSATTMPVNAAEPQPHPIDPALIASLTAFISQMTEDIGLSDLGRGPTSSPEDAGIATPGGESRGAALY